MISRTEHFQTVVIGYFDAGPHRQFEPLHRTRRSRPFGPILCPWLVDHADPYQGAYFGAVNKYGASVVRRRRVARSHVGLCGNSFDGDATDTRAEMDAARWRWYGARESRPHKMPPVGGARKI